MLDKEYRLPVRRGRRQFSQEGGAALKERRLSFVVSRPSLEESDGRGTVHLWIGQRVH
jgi:hypothetical protein